MKNLLKYIFSICTPLFILPSCNNHLSEDQAYYATITSSVNTINDQANSFIETNLRQVLDSVKLSLGHNISQKLCDSVTLNTNELIKKINEGRLNISEISQPKDEYDLKNNSLVFYKSLSEILSISIPKVTKLFVKGVDNSSPKEQKEVEEIMVHLYELKQQQLNLLDLMSKFHDAHSLN